MDVGDRDLDKGINPDDGNVRLNKLQHRRGNLLLLFAGVALLVVFVAIITPLLVLRDKDTHNALLLSSIEQAAADQIGIAFRNAIIDAVAVSGTMQGFLASEISILPSISDPPSKRVEGQSFPRFPVTAANAARDQPTIASIALAPGGVLFDMYPPDPATYGRDMFDPTGTFMQQKPTPVDVMLSGSAAITRPVRSTVSYMVDQWIISVRAPVYNLTSSPQIQLSQFWGFVSVSSNISYIMTKQNVSEVFEALGMDYILYGTVENGTYFVVKTSLLDPSPEEVRDFIENGVGNERFLPSVNFSIAVQSRGRRVRLSSGNVAVVVCSAVLGAVFLYAVGAIVMVCCTEPYNGARHAPKKVPFAIVTVGVKHSDRMWAAVPEAMDAYVEGLLKTIKRRGEMFHTYNIGQQRPYTVSLVARTADALLHMSFSIIEQMQRDGADEKLREALSKAGLPELSHPAIVGCFVHWCTDATVFMDPFTKGYSYVGPDVDLALRLFTFAAPNTVTVSGKAKAALSAPVTRTLSIAYLGEDPGPRAKAGKAGGAPYGVDGALSSSSSSLSDHHHHHHHAGGTRQHHRRRRSCSKSNSSDSSEEVERRPAPRHRQPPRRVSQELRHPPQQRLVLRQSGDDDGDDPAPPFTLASAADMGNPRSESYESGKSPSGSDDPATTLYTVTDRASPGLQEALAVARDVARQKAESKPRPAAGGEGVGTGLGLNALTPPWGARSALFRVDSVPEEDCTPETRRRKQREERAEAKANATQRREEARARAAMHDRRKKLRQQARRDAEKERKARRHRLSSNSNSSDRSNSSSSSGAGQAEGRSTAFVPLARSFSLTHLADNEGTEEQHHHQGRHRRRRESGEDRASNRSSRSGGDDSCESEYSTKPPAMMCHHDPSSSLPSTATSFTNGSSYTFSYSLTASATATSDGEERVAGAEHASSRGGLASDTPLGTAMHMGPFSTEEGEEGEEEEGRRLSPHTRRGRQSSAPAAAAGPPTLAASNSWSEVMSPNTQTLAEAFTAAVTQSAATAPIIPPLPRTTAAGDAAEEGEARHREGSFIADERPLPSTSTANGKPASCAIAGGAAERQRHRHKRKHRHSRPPAHRVNGAGWQRATTHHGLWRASGEVSFGVSATAADSLLNHSQRATSNSSQHSGHSEQQQHHHHQQQQQQQRSTVKANQVARLGYDISAAAAISTTGPATLMVTAEEDDAVARLLITPNIPAWLDTTLRLAFERQAVAIDLEYEAVRVVVYFFYCSTKLLFRPLAAVERENIYKRLVTAFGVPPRELLENLAARCVIRYMQRHEEAKSYLYDFHLKEREQQQQQQQHQRRVTSVTESSTATRPHRISDGGPADSSVHPGLVGSSSSSASARPPALFHAGHPSSSALGAFGYAGPTAGGGSDESEGNAIAGGSFATGASFSASMASSSIAVSITAAGTGLGSVADHSTTIPPGADGGGATGDRQ